MAQAKRDENRVTTLLAVSSVDGVTPVVVYADPTTHRLLTDLSGGTGTVTSVSVTSANGFAGTVATATTTPAITISTTITGILKGNGTAISAATDGTDYLSSTTGLKLDQTSAQTISNDSPIFNTLTASELVATTAAKKLQSLAVATYPSLTEISYVKGVTSAIQTQINAKQATITFGTGVQTALGVNIGSAGAPVLFNGALGTPSSGTVTNLTGTASININGTVGATTPTTGVFTTLVAGSTTSLLLGTAGSAVGNIGFRNATSGTITLAPVTGALGTVTLTLPAITDTIVTLTATQTLTNKTLTSPTLTTPALGTPASGVMTNVTGTATGLTSGITNALKSATTTVDVSAATAPSSGQVLTATGSTAATWQTPSGGSSIPNGATWNTIFESTSRFTKSNSGTSSVSSVATSTDYGFTLATGTQTAGQAELYTMPFGSKGNPFGASANADKSVFTLTIKMTTIYSGHVIFCGLAENTTAFSSGVYGLGTTRHAGLKITGTGTGTANLVASSGSTTAETNSSTLTTLADADSIFFVGEVNYTASEVKYYWSKNGAALSSATTITGDFPSQPMRWFVWGIGNSGTQTNSAVIEGYTASILTRE